MAIEGKQIYLGGTPITLIQNNGFVHVDPTSIEPSPWLLDNYSAVAGYSVRKLSLAATSAFRVKRTSDNSEQDIGFDVNGNLDTGSLTSFVGGATGRIVDWYDQSGNGNHASLAFGDGPEVVITGTLQTSNGKLAPYFLSNGTQPDALDAPNFISPDAAKTVYVVYTPTAVGTNDNVFNLCNSGVSLQQWTFAARPEVDVAGAYYQAAAVSTNNQHLVNVVQSGSAMISDFDMYIDGAFASPAASVTGTVGSNTSGTFVIGGSNTIGGGFYYGKTQELIVFGSQLSGTNRTAVETDINDYYSIYV
jgi:hypothetical protein